MRWTDIRERLVKATPERELRQFGLILALILILVFLYQMIIKGLFSPLTGSIGIIILILALARPSLLRFLYNPWVALARFIGSVITRIILSLVFYLVILPIAFIIRITRKDLLDIRETNSETYWKERPLKAIDMERQF